MTDTVSIGRDDVRKKVYLERHLSGYLWEAYTLRPYGGYVVHRAWSYSARSAERKLRRKLARKQRRHDRKQERWEVPFDR